MRLMYHGIGKVGVSNFEAKKLLRHLSIKQGKKYDDPRSKKEIQSFIDFHNLNVEEILEPLESFPNFNEFFFRKLTPIARPISFPDDPRIAVSPADCRLNVFVSIGEATRLWIKGKHFSIASLLVSEELAAKYDGGSLLIARLAPQDYHRFHIPVNGTLVESVPLDGTLYTVNPIAVRESIDVYTENKRIRNIIRSPQFGDVLYLAIGATMVGRIILTAQVGDQVKKGGEAGYFAFGGSTIILLFEKGVIRFDEDLVVNSSKPIETLIKMGDHIGLSTKQ